VHDCLVETQNNGGVNTNGEGLGVEACRHPEKKRSIHFEKTVQRVPGKLSPA